VRDRGWLIETRETDLSGRARERRIGSVNGREIFQINSTPQTNHVKAPPQTGGPMLVHADEGQVVSNTVPLGTLNDSIIPHLWTMLASGCYFSGLSRTSRLLPALDVDPALGGRVDLRLEAEWDLMSGQLALPLRLIYYNAGGFYTMNTNKEVVFCNYGPPYKAGFTNAIYLVTVMTNFDGVPFPAGFSFAEFVPGAGRSRYDLRPRKTAEAVVTAFRPECSRKELLPAVEATTLVRDMRLSPTGPSAGSFGYVLRKGDHWLTAPEARGSSKIGKQSTARKVSPFLVVSLIVVLTAPLVVLLSRTWLGGRKK